VIKKNAFLVRPGNKQHISEKIIQHFPVHTAYVELFFGAGGIFFNKPKAKFNFLNDINQDIFNLYMVYKEHPEDLIQAVKDMPEDQALFNYWKKVTPENKVQQAVRFLLLSKWSYLGGRKTMVIRKQHYKENLIERLYRNMEFLTNTMITILMAESLRL
jgi:DNA adenine methylase